MDEKMETTKNNKEASYISKLPTELLYMIFQNLSANDLMKSRRVSTQWRTIIDELASNDSTWINFCRQDFNSCYLRARLNANPELKWFNLYKSLYLWPKLGTAVEQRRKTTYTHSEDEIRSLEVLSKGVLTVHRKSKIEYHDIEPFKLSTKYKPVEGDYQQYTENEHVIVIQSIWHLFVILKYNNVRNHTITFDNVKTFLLTDSKLFFVKLNDEIYVCDIRNESVTPKLLQPGRDQDVIMSLGYGNGDLNILTYKRNIYSIIVEKKFIQRPSLDKERNILAVLHKYNLLEQLDWNAFYHWLFVLRIPTPEEPMSNITVIKPYGDIYFVGSQYGVLSIFHKPYVNGKFDIFNSRPIKQVSLMKKCTIYASVAFSILKIDVVEIENGHIVCVAFPTELVMLKYTH